MSLSAPKYLPQRQVAFATKSKFITCSSGVHARGLPRTMTTVRPFTCDDLFTYNDVNTDVFTETFNLNFYLGYLATWWGRTPDPSS